MPTIIKTFLGVFFFMLMVFSGTGLIKYNIDVNAAADFKQNVVEELQNSNMSPDVINSCINTGKTNGYNVIITAIHESTTSTFRDGNYATVSMPEVESAYVVIEYKLKLPFFKVTSQKTERGFVK